MTMYTVKSEIFIERYFSSLRGWWISRKFYNNQMRFVRKNVPNLYELETNQDTKSSNDIIFKKRKSFTEFLLDSEFDFCIYL